MMSAFPAGQENMADSCAAAAPESNTAKRMQRTRRTFIALSRNPPNGVSKDIFRCRATSQRLAPVAVRMSRTKVFVGVGEQQDDASARENAVIKLLDFLF